jgi:mono/diheme cytochrome c family protein
MMIRMTAAAIMGLALAGVACGGDRRGAPNTGGGSAAAGAPTDPRAGIFVSKGCQQCHSISALGIKSAAEVGPDLTRAYEDVKNRFGVELEQFLHNPTGTMQVVLSSTIQLTPAERDSIIHILKGLHEEREEREEAEQSTKPQSSAIGKGRDVDRGRSPSSPPA